ncbi:MAG: response regulator [Magnetococcus sp. YQC-5]
MEPSNIKDKATVRLLQATDENHRLAEEILRHVAYLMNTPLTDEQRDRLQSIRQAAEAWALSGMETNLPEPDSIQESLANQPSEQEWTPEPQPVTTPRRILLVEDSSSTQELISRLLTRQGYQVTLAKNGQEALDHLATSSFDLTLMDLRMPVMDGFVTTQAIRHMEEQRRAVHMPIIAVTALLQEEDKNRAMAVGMDDYHAKPIQIKTLFAQMERLLSRANTPPQEPPAPPLIVDIKQLLKTVDGDRELLQEITDLYFADAPRQMARIQRALASGDADEIREAAHSLKGATGAFGRIEVYHLAFDLEQAGRQGNLQQAAMLWNQLGEALQTMKQIIQKEIQDQMGESS